MGWPEVWPSDHEKGHFFMVYPSWIDSDATPHEITELEGMLIDVRDVKWLEFVKKPEENK